MIRLALLATLALSALPAQAFTASNEMLVQSTGEGTFTVPYKLDPAASAFWCAAGEYVTFALGQRGDTLIYRTSPVPRRSGEAVSFSLSPSASTGKTGLAVIGTDNGAITAGLAQGLCAKFNQFERN